MLRLANAFKASSEGASSGALPNTNGLQTVEDVVASLNVLAKSAFKPQMRGQAQAAMAMKPKAKSLPKVKTDEYGAVSVVSDADEKIEPGVYKNMGEAQRAREEMRRIVCVA